MLTLRNAGVIFWDNKGIYYFEYYKRMGEGCCRKF